jgi:small-conductance mechanosensitive channel
MNALQALPKIVGELTPERAAIVVANVAGALALAYVLAWLLRGRQRPERSLWFGKHLYDGVLFPLFALIIGLIESWVLREVRGVGLVRLAVAVFASLLVIRVTAQVMRAAFPNSLWVKRLERTVSWLVWGILVLWLTGLLPLISDELEALHWRIGGTNVSLLALLQGALSVVAVLIAVLWLSASIEARLLRGAVGAELSARKIAANATRAALLLVGLLVALSAAGIPISALSVMSGAVGVGIGLGLQKLAANYVSGFVILAERSLRIGDLVKVDNFEGHVTDITMRYTLIRALSGRESIVPNEMLITQRVENSSLADRNVLVSTVVQVAYGTDLAALMPALADVVRAVTRVMHDPPPSVQLTAFAADGLELTVNFSVADPENGLGNVRSAVNLALLAALDARGVEIPFPQRVLHPQPPTFAGTAGRGG